MEATNTLRLHRSQLTNFVHHHWEGEKTVMCRNNFDWDCSSSAHSFQIDDGSLSGHSSLCGFTFSRTDDASSIENLMLFDKVESEVWEVERDVQITSALLKVEKKKLFKDSTLSLSVIKTWLFYVTFARIELTLFKRWSRTKSVLGFSFTLLLNVVLF